MELISREEVLTFARTVYKTGGIPTQIVEVFDIKRLPTIESRPKGKWRTSRVHGGIVKCDFCGFDWGSNEGRKFNYCPNCGADMRGETE